LLSIVVSRVVGKASHKNCMVEKNGEKSADLSSWKRMLMNILVISYFCNIFKDILAESLTILIF